MTGSRPLLLGHRGARASVSVPENTTASFDLCLQQGCDGFEFDVRGTADGVPVVCHDPSFRGIKLARTGSRDLSTWQAQGFLPTLEEVLRRYSRCFLDIEIKSAGLEAQVLELLRRYPPEPGYVVTSFLPEVLLRLRELDPKTELGFLWDRPATAWGNLPVQWVLPERGLLDVSLAQALRGAGKRIGVWTVNDPPEMLQLVALGAEMLISDDTVRLVNTFLVI
jgi:glycerophosphoryl diester phosphodiesterase